MGIENMFLPRYFTNVAASLSKTASKALGDELENSTRFLNTNKELINSTVNSVKNYKVIAKVAKDKFNESDSTKILKDAFRNFKSDLKTGKWNNTDRFELDDSQKMLWDAGKQFDTNQRRTAVSVAQTSIKAQSKMAEGLGRSINKNGMLFMKYANENISPFIEKSTSYYTDSYKVQLSIQEILAKTLEVHTSYYRSTQTMLEQRKEKQTDSEKMNLTDGADLKEYGKIVKQNFSRILDDSGMGGLFSMAGGTDTLKALAENPIDAIFGSTIQKLLMPKNIKKSLSSLDKSFGGFLPSLALRMNKIGQEGIGEASDNDSTLKKLMKEFSPYLGKLLGVRTKQSVQYDSGNYIKGAIPFDGVTKKAITDVIPMYLRKILAAVSKDEEILFNYSKGQAIYKDEYKRMLDTSWKGNIGYDLQNLSSKVVNNIDPSKKLDKETSKSYKDAINKYLLANSGQLLDIRNFKEFENNFSKKSGVTNLSDEELKKFFQGFSMLSNEEKLGSSVSSIEQAKKNINNRKSMIEDDLLTGLSQYSSDSGLGESKKSSEIAREKTRMKDANSVLKKERIASIKTLVKIGSTIQSVLLHGVISVRNVRGKELAKRSNHMNILSMANRADDNNPKKPSSNPINTSTSAVNENTTPPVTTRSQTEVAEDLITNNSSSKKDKENEEQTESIEDNRNFLQKMKDKLFSRTKNSFSIFTDSFDKFTKNIENKMVSLIFGNDNQTGDKGKRSLFGMLDNQLNKMKDIFNKFTGKMKEIFNPMKDKLMNKLFGEKDEDGNRKGGKLSKVNDGFKGFINDVFGSEKVLSDGTKLDKNENAFTQTIKNEYIKPFITKTQNYLLGDQYEDADGNKKRKGGFLKEMVESISKPVKLFSNTIKDSFYGKGSSKKDKTGSSDPNKYTFEDSNFFNEVQKNIPNVTKGALKGGVMGLLFGPAGLLIGGLGGSLLSLTKSSESVKNYLLGDDNKSGIISKDLQKSVMDKFKKYLPHGAKGFKSGAIGGGLLGLMFGPAGLLVGSLGGGLLKASNGMDKITHMLFGDKDEETGKRKGGFVSKNLMNKFKKFLPAGAAGGILATVMTGSPLLGSLGAVGLAGANMAIQSDKFKNFLFGDKDEESGKRKGGLVGSVTGMFKTAIFNPLKASVKQTTLNMSKWFTEKIANPFQDALAPFKQEMKNFFKGLTEGSKKFAFNLANKFDKAFVNVIGMPLTEAVTTKIIDPIKRTLNKVFSSTFKLFGKAISAPFKFLKNKSEKLQRKHVMNGTADYLSDENKRKAERDAKQDKKFKDKQAQINDLISKNTDEEKNFKKSEREKNNKNKERIFQRINNRNRFIDIENSIEEAGGLKKKSRLQNYLDNRRYKKMTDEEKVILNAKNKKKKEEAEAKKANYINNMSLEDQMFFGSKLSSGVLGKFVTNIKDGNKRNNIANANGLILETDDEIMKKVSSSDAKTKHKYLERIKRINPETYHRIMKKIDPNYVKPTSDVDGNDGTIPNPPKTATETASSEVKPTNGTTKEDKEGESIKKAETTATQKASSEVKPTNDSEDKESDGTIPNPSKNATQKASSEVKPTNDSEDKESDGTIPNPPKNATETASSEVKPTNGNNDDNTTSDDTTSNNKPKNNNISGNPLVDTARNTATIAEEIDGQLDGVGYNVSRIAKILAKKYGDEEGDGLEGSRGNKKRKGLLGKIKEAILSPFTFLKNKFKNGIDKIKGFFGGIKDTLLKPITLITSTFKGFGKGLKFLGDTVSSVGKGIGSVVGTLSKGVKSGVETVKIVSMYALDGVKKGFDVLKGGLKLAGKGIKSALDGVAIAGLYVLDGVKKVGSGIKTALFGDGKDKKGIFGSLGNTFAKFNKGLKTALFGDGKDKKGIFGTLKKFGSGFKTMLFGDGKDKKGIFGSLWNKTKNLGHGISSVASSGVNKIKEKLGFKSKVQKVFVVGGTIDKVKHVSNIGEDGKFFPILPSVPGFAKGTNSSPEGTALVGEKGPELVSLPKGSKVKDAKKTKSILGSASQQEAKEKQEENSAYKEELLTTLQSISKNETQEKQGHKSKGWLLGLLGVAGGVFKKVIDKFIMNPLKNLFNTVIMTPLKMFGKKALSLLGGLAKFLGGKALGGLKAVGSMGVKGLKALGGKALGGLKAGGSKLGEKLLETNIGNRAAEYGLHFGEKGLNKISGSKIGGKLLGSKLGQKFLKSGVGSKMGSLSKFIKAGEDVAGDVAGKKGGVLGKVAGIASSLLGGGDGGDPEMEQSNLADLAKNADMIVQAQTVIVQGANIQNGGSSSNEGNSVLGDAKDLYDSIKGKKAGKVVDGVEDLAEDLTGKKGKNVLKAVDTVGDVAEDLTKNKGLLSKGKGLVSRGVKSVTDIGTKALDSFGGGSKVTKAIDGIADVGEKVISSGGLGEKLSKAITSIVKNPMVEKMIGKEAVEALAVKAVPNIIKKAIPMLSAAAASGGIALFANVAFSAGEFLAGVMNPHRVLQVDPSTEIPTNIRVCAGLGKCVSQLLFGVIPESTIAMIFIKVFNSWTKGGKQEIAKIQQSQKAMQEQAQKQGQTIEEYNKSKNQSFGSKAWSAVTDGAKWVGNEAKKLGSSIYNGVSNGAKWIGNKVSEGASWLRSKFGWGDPAKERRKKSQLIKSNINPVTGAKLNGRGTGRGTTYFSQKDKRWADMPYQASNDIYDDNMSDAGCGPTAAAIALSKFDKHANPVDAAKYAMNNGYKVSGQGTSSDFISDYAHSRGLNLNENVVRSSNDINNIAQQVNSGVPVVALGSGTDGDSPYTKAGHYVVIDKVNKDGTAQISDPMNASNNSKKYNLNSLVSNTSSYWASNNSPVPVPQSSMSGYGGTKGEAIINVAKEHIGTPYIWGGKANTISKQGLANLYSQYGNQTSTDNKTYSYWYDQAIQQAPGKLGFDCSGLTQYAYKNGANISSIGPSTITQWNDKSLQTINREGLKPSDLVFFDRRGGNPQHVGIYMGGGKFLEAPKTGQNIKVTDIDSNYWKSKFIGGKRALPADQIPDGDFSSGLPTGGGTASGGASDASGGASGTDPQTQSEGLFDKIGTAMKDITNFAGAVLLGKTAEYNAGTFSLFGGSSSGSSSGGASDASGGASGIDAGTGDIKALLSNYHILSGIYEVGGQNPNNAGKLLTDPQYSGFVSSGDGDYGGKSYGLPQFTKDNIPAFTNYLKQASPDLGGMLTATPNANNAEYAAQWKQVAQKNPEQFGTQQWNFGNRLLYNPTASKVASVSGRPEASWSITEKAIVNSAAMQYGSLYNNIMGNALKANNPTQEINTIYDTKAANVAKNFRGSSSDVQAGVANRITKEKQLALQMAQAESQAKSGGQPDSGTPTSTPTGNGRGHGRGKKKQNDAAVKANGVVNYQNSLANTFSSKLTGRGLSAISNTSNKVNVSPNFSSNSIQMLSGVNSNSKIEKLLEAILKILATTSGNSTEVVKILTDMLKGSTTSNTVSNTNKSSSGNAFIPQSNMPHNDTNQRLLESIQRIASGN